MTSDTRIESAAGQPAAPESFRDMMDSAYETMGRMRAAIQNYRDQEGDTLYGSWWLGMFSQSLPSGRENLMLTGRLDADFDHANNYYNNNLVRDIESLSKNLKLDYAIPVAAIGELVDNLSHNREIPHSEYWSQSKVALFEKFLADTAAFDQKTKVGGDSPYTLADIRARVQETLSFNREIYPVLQLSHDAHQFEYFVNSKLVGEDKALEQPFMSGGDPTSPEFIAAFSSSLEYLHARLTDTENPPAYKFLFDDTNYGRSLKMDIPLAEGQPPVTFAWSLDPENIGYGVPFDPQTGRYYCMVTDPQTGNEAMTLAEIVPHPETGQPVFATADKDGMLEYIEAQPAMPGNPVFKAVELLAMEDEKDDVLAGLAKKIIAFGPENLAGIESAIAQEQELADMAESLDIDIEDARSHYALITLKSHVQTVVESGMFGDDVTCDLQSGLLDAGDPEFVDIIKDLMGFSQDFDTRFTLQDSGEKPLHFDEIDNAAVQSLAQIEEHLRLNPGDSASLAEIGGIENLRAAVTALTESKNMVEKIGIAYQIGILEDDDVNKIMDDYGVGFPEGVESAGDKITFLADVGQFFNDIYAGLETLEPEQQQAFINALNGEKQVSFNLQGTGIEPPSESFNIRSGVDPSIGTVTNVAMETKHPEFHEARFDLTQFEDRTAPGQHLASTPAFKGPAA